ncbi:uncharacterized protein N7473_001806 [Penicillium subrubescens]|uniref:DUF3533 domain-containing protein n=1 Tax=Penicillium subrubescens TaxID=1316194 RepID=A0A1Q5U2L0_9EURO|nr:uncharacterized protein N7473_001806 [Penicillium subrubescens]KAJ5904890.1 hypothetical protein N7473_001806 [Penicillium subrubescens]OKP06722.1 hypothetical protein PENSUB_6218 [Penicillium subrubescens]
MQIPRQFLGGVGGSFVLIQLLFLANMGYLYGTAFNDSQRIKALKLLFVDYDHGIIGQSVRAAYSELENSNFPTLTESLSIDFPSASDIRKSVCKGHYWGAIYVNQDASSRLSTALASPETAGTYENSYALSYVFNSARYPAYAQTISSSLQILVQGARTGYNAINGTAAMSKLNTTDQNIAQILLDPISATYIDIKPTAQGVRFYYNTVSMAMVILPQFFFIMALNGISAQTKIFQSFSLRKNISLRLGLSVCFTFIASLCMSGYIWAFREDWGTTSSQYGLTWMIIWLVMHLNFFIIDSVTAVIPVQFMPFFILTWIIMNVSSTLSPFELSPGFYRIGYALPAYELYQVLLDIWTHGCNPTLYRSLPILFAWWLVSAVTFFATMRRRVLLVSAKPGEPSISDPEKVEPEGRGY